MSEKLQKSKFHWYDGKFYDKIIAPNQKRLFGQISELIEPASTLLDVGCGTGYFSFHAEWKCKSVLGIDLSKRNIEHANQNLSIVNSPKLSFRQISVEKLLAEKAHFDVAIMTYVIHEVNEHERIPLLRAISQLADKIIIGDYIVPQPKSSSGRLTKIIEFVAGREHYRNFKNYSKNGGVHYLAKKANLNVITEIVNNTDIIVLFTISQNKKKNQYKDEKNIKTFNRQTNFYSCHFRWSCLRYKFLF